MGSEPGSSYKFAAGATKYTRTHTDRDNSLVGGTVDLTKNLTFALSYAHQYKLVNAEDAADTTAKSNNRRYKRSVVDTSLDWTRGPFRIITGVQTFFGEMIQPTITSSKNNTGIYLQSFLDIDNSTKVSLGGRYEKVSYTMDNAPENPTFRDYTFWVYDIGANKTINNHLSIFSNFNTSFLAPDIDRIFGFNAAFTAKNF